MNILMQNSKSHINNKVYFSRWSRKSYAVFTSLGQDVKISRLSVDMCAKALLKLSKLSMFFFEMLDSVFNKLDKVEDDEPAFTTIICNNSENTNLVTVTDTSSSDKRDNNFNKYIKDNLGYLGCLFVL